MLDMSICEGCGRVMVRGEEGWIEVARSEAYCSNCYEPIESDDALTADEALEAGATTEADRG